MLEYVYIVKCPNCEDEHFYFFDDAKECAMGQLTKQPIITQVEVNRNDFGECTDSCDLGTVWSWEDMMKDVPAEPESMAFNKADTLDCNDDYFNQEFDDLDNSLDSLSDYSRKPATRITEADGREDPEEERRKAQTQRGYDSNKAPSSSSTSARDNDLENRASRTQLGYDSNKQPSASGVSARDNDVENRASKTQLGYNPHQAPSKAETSARDNDLENRDAIAPDQKTISKVLVKYATLMPYDMYDKLEGKAAQVLKASKPWWLKSPGDEAGYAMCVMENGGMTEKSVASKQGLRPVIEVIPADFADDKLYQPVKAMNGDWIKISDKYLLLKDPTEMVAFDALNTLRNDFDRANIKNTLDAWCEKYFKSVGAVFGSNSAEYTREVSKQLDRDAKREAFDVRKPVPADMTVEQLVEEMEENEDTVECKWCDELFDKSECRYEVDLGWLCDRCQAAILSRGEQLTFREGQLKEAKIDTNWALNNASPLIKQKVADDTILGINLDNAIEQRNRYAKQTGKCPVCGGDLDDMICTYCKLSYRQNGCSGWNTKLIDALLIRSIEKQDPKFKNLSIDDKVEYVFNAYFGNPNEKGNNTEKRVDRENNRNKILGHSGYDESANRVRAAKQKIKQELLLADKRETEINAAFANIKTEAYVKEDVYSFAKSDINSFGNIPEPVDESYSSDPHDQVELEYPKLTVTLYGPKRAEDDWDEVEHTDSHVFLVPKVEVTTAIWENWITEEDVADVEGGLEALEDDAAWEKFLETHFDTLFEKYNKQILEYFKEEATEDFRERSQEDYSLGQWKDNSDDAYDAWRDEKYFGESVQKPFLEEFDDAETHKANLIDCPECGTVSYDMKEQYCTNCGLGL